MPSPRILLIGPGDDATLERLELALRVLGAEPLRADLDRFPHDARLTVNETGLWLDELRLDACDAAYVARGVYMSAVPEWVPSAQEWPALRETIHQAVRARQEERSVRASTLMLLAERMPVVNPPAVLRSVRLLPSLLRRWERAGLAVAPFVSGNDLEQIAYFVDSCGERCRARRLWQGPDQERVADFGFLTGQPDALDRHPLLVRQHTGGARRDVVVVGERAWPQGAVEAASTEPPALDDSTRHLATAAAKLAGAPVAVVHVEADEDGSPWLLGLDPEPDLVRLEEAGAQGLVDEVARLLVDRTSATAGSRTASSPSPPLPGPRTERPIVGIAGRVADAEVAALGRALTERGARALPLELPLFPDRRALHEARDGGRIGPQELGELDAIFLRTTGYRSPLPPEDHEPLAPEAFEALYPAWRHFVRDQGESFELKYAVLEVLGQRIPVVNPPLAQEVHRTKVRQLFSLQAAGLPVPPTTATNDSAQARRFVEEQGGPAQVVVKPLAGIYKTRLLADFEGGLAEALTSGPAILQRYVRGDTLRTYIVAGELVGVGRILHSGRSVDSSVEQQGVEPTELPDEVVATGWRAAQHLGLSWTGMDFQRDERSGAHFILECNASAMFAAFSRLTGYDVPGALAELLLGLARRA